MNLRRWLSVILLVGLILALSSLSAQADPCRPYWHPRGHAYGWDGPRHHGFDRCDRHYWRSWKGPHHRYYVDRVYGGPPVAYVAPIAPVMGIPYAAPQQPYYPNPGLSGQVQLNF